MYEYDTLHFEGNGWIKFQKMCDIYNTFTYEFWVMAEEEQMLDQEQNVGEDGLQGKKYLVGPDFYPVGAAGCGISVGTNGISVYEHSINHLPARLVLAYDFSDWQHVAIVLDNRRLQLYINGEWVKEESTPSNVEKIRPSLCLGGHVYGTFKGQVKEFRLWATARTKDEINANMFSSLNGNETGLYFYRDPARNLVVSQGISINPEVSVIMPSNNRSPLNYFSLLCLDQQQFPKQQMEVVFLDDGSKDSTESIYDLLNPSYSFIYVQRLNNTGRSKIRNTGAGIAAGQILLFLDTEMICGPDFVMNHVTHHRTGERKIVSGSMRGRRIYTVADPNYSPEQKLQMKEIYTDHPVAAPLIEHFLQSDSTPVQLLPFEMMFDLNHLYQWSISSDYFESILLTFGSKFKQFQYSWMNMTTNNVSMSKRFFEGIGGFDEHFMGFGWEDWEFGYRAVKKGALFIHDDGVINFHQEHSAPIENMIQSRQNFLRFHEKYPQDMEIKFLALTMEPDWVTLTELNGYLTEYNNIRAIYKNRFEAFHYYLDRAFNLLLARLRQHGVITLPIADSVISQQENEALEEDLYVIRELGAFPKLLELSERLSKYYY
ncbi:glycosyltransferase [Paenibacillus donghaensis]|uniref:Glycosyltransferase 2-like domain-containing protein n=1 Tax=Paenibacillus donghaensis TaxID=414771 RepID=A0A2Z2K3G2_9BACL|nr:glycosyltransferase [Paenibacillus donghaensis]ASA19866.1 hypothetical protein B9T62_03030 [Paenibacillus donghaensis]